MLKAQKLKKKYDQRQLFSRKTHQMSIHRINNLISRKKKFLSFKDAIRFLLDDLAEV
jgi:hypothetical protein